MKIPPISAGLVRRRRQSGLTLVEIMVASSLLLVILVSLMMMFNQTQRAFRIGLRQNDVMESGRAALDMIAREVEQMSAAYRPGIPNAQVKLHSPSPAFPPFQFDSPDGTTQTEYLQSFFFLKYDGNWNALGYRVLHSTVHTQSLDQVDNILVGALYNFQTNFPEIYTNEHLDTFHGVPLNMINDKTMRRIVDGVVHFKISFYDQRGMPFTNNIDLGWAVTNHLTVAGMTNVDLSGAALPAVVDLELGILEPQALQQVRPLIADGNYTGVRNYLSNHCGKIHIFRRQIPIRTAIR